MKDTDHGLFLCFEEFDNIGGTFGYAIRFSVKKKIEDIRKLNKHRGPYLIINDVRSLFN